jgi:sulfur carrier protein ThiS
MTTIFFTDNSGAGFSDNLTISSGLTVEAFMAERNIDPKLFSVRVNRQPAVMAATLSENDRVTVVPLKIAGA